MEAKSTTTTVVLTGFGPFGEHRINSSWEAVKELASIGFDDNINLITKEIPVQYDVVSDLVPKLWDDFMPKLCVHVGVSHYTNVLQLEKCAFNSKYACADIMDKCPNRDCCIQGGCECLITNLNVEKICRESAEKNCPCKLQTSCDAGRFLCGFIYYRSLHESLKAEHKGSSAVFIHVPMLDHPYNKTQLAQALKYVIMEMLKDENLQDRCALQDHDCHDQNH